MLAERQQETLTTCKCHVWNYSRDVLCCYFRDNNGSKLDLQTRQNSWCWCQEASNQEALLLQTDCTTRYIKRNLVDCCTIVGTRSTTNSYEIEVMQLEHCGRRMCVCASSHTSTVISVVNKLDRPWTLLTPGIVKSYRNFEDLVLI